MYSSYCLRKFEISRFQISEGGGARAAYPITAQWFDKNRQNKAPGSRLDFLALDDLKKRYEQRCHFRTYFSRYSRLYGNHRQTRIFLRNYLPEVQSCPWYLHIEYIGNHKRRSAKPCCWFPAERLCATINVLYLRKNLIGIFRFILILQ